jgi:hypothetical protein
MMSLRLMLTQISRSETLAYKPSLKEPMARCSLRTLHVSLLYNANTFTPSLLQRLCKRHRPEGLFLITWSRIAEGANQMIVITGDQIKIIEMTGAWHRGRNIFTSATGIFPSACGIMSSDLLYSETAAMLLLAVDTLLNPAPWTELPKLADRIADVMTQVSLCFGTTMLATRSLLRARR